MADAVILSELELEVGDDFNEWLSGIWIDEEESSNRDLESELSVAANFSAPIQPHNTLQAYANNAVLDYVHDDFKLPEASGLREEAGVSMELSENEYGLMADSCADLETPFLDMGFEAPDTLGPLTSRGSAASPVVMPGGGLRPATAREGQQRWVRTVRTMQEQRR
eukprot:480683-Hanusia_phi.AAC.1